jgi:oxygen-independent coproporphyrinogen-3 oxidase
MAGIYIHIPFCKSRCRYCDFFSTTQLDKREAYIQAVIQEWQSHQPKWSQQEIRTIYLGGGTPSHIDSKHISQVLGFVRNNYIVNKDAEITIEINPGTVNKNKLQDYYKAGINRISFGVQSTDNQMLKNIGRIHSYEEFVKNFLEARSIGFNNISVDLIFGLPEQNIANWKQTLEDIISLNPEHISAYSLKVEEGTVFGEKYNKGKLIL